MTLGRVGTDDTGNEWYATGPRRRVYRDDEHEPEPQPRHGIGVRGMPPDRWDERPLSARPTFYDDDCDPQDEYVPYQWRRHTLDSAQFPRYEVPQMRFSAAAVAYVSAVMLVVGCLLGHWVLPLVFGK